MRVLSVSGLAVVLLVVLVAGMSPTESSLQEMVVPEYDADGALLRPTGFETWVLVGASIGLGYSDAPKTEEPGRFHNIYMQPQAYTHYTRYGEFPEKTMFAMSVYSAGQKLSINRQGFFEDEFVALEVALKDHDRFKEGWAYFDFGKSGQRSTAFPRERCFTCHQTSGADDNVFVQFYPLLRQAKDRAVTR